MRLWIAIHLYRLGLDSWCQRELAGLMQLAAAIVDQDRIQALTPGAASLGVSHGMRRASALALAPALRLAERDAAGERELFDQVALAMLQYTPEVVQGDESVLLLGVGASLLAFGGPRALCRRIGRSLRALRVSARLGMAPTATGAWLLARQPGRGRRRRVLGMAGLRRLGDALPCLLLPEARPYRSWLEDIGCRSLGGLLRLPRSGLQQRTGPTVLQALDRYLGVAPEVRVLFIAPPVFDRVLELPERIEHAPAALFATAYLLEQLGGWLTARRQATTGLELLLKHERGRHAIPPTSVPIRLAEPAWQAAHLQKLLTEKLGRLVLRAPIIAIRLRVSAVTPLQTPDGALLPLPGGTPADHRRLLELLVARLGREQVLRPHPRADHRPEVANAWLPVDDAARGVATQWPAGLERPFWLLSEPLALALRGARPVYGKAVLRLVRGPERLEAGWWEGGLVARDYFVAEDAQAARYWIYRERDAAEGAGWFLHGLFA